MNSKLLAACGAALLLAIGAQAQSVDTVMSSNLFEPHGLASDGTNVFITDGGLGNCVVKIGLDGLLAPVAGRTGYSGAADGFGSQARFADPQGIVMVRGTLYVADAGNYALRAIDPIANKVSTVAGSTDALAYPAGLATDGSNVFIADYGNGAIVKYDTIQSNFTTVVADGIGWPSAVAVGDNGDLWVADAHNSAIYRVTSTGTNLVAGIPGSIGSDDSIFAWEGRFNGPRGLLWRTSSGLLISDTGNNTIRRLYWNTNSDVLGWSLETVAGIAGVAGSTNSLALSSTFNAPMGLTPDFNSSGFYIADSASKAIRRYRQNSTPGTPVTAPRIGFVQFVLDPGTKQMVSSFVDATGQSLTFYTATNLVIDTEKGTQTYYSYGPTPTDAFNDTIPNPAISGTPVTPYPGDGMTVDVFYQHSPTVLDSGATLTIKAISRQNDRPSSPVVSANFQFICGPPSIGGINSASLPLGDMTGDAHIYYTLDRSDPTTNLTGRLSAAPGDVLTFAITEDTPIRLVAIRDGFQSSFVVSNMLFASNYLANRLTFGFESNQVASTHFYGAAGQTFYAPVTLSLMPGQSMYTLQFSVAITNAGSSFAAQNYSFDSKLLEALSGGDYRIIPPAMSYGSLLHTDPAISLLGVGWVERYGATNLYNTLNQQLIKYSLAHDVFFNEDAGKVVVGAYHFKIPDNAPPGTAYQIELGAASATADGVSAPVLMQLPTNADFSRILSIQTVRVLEKPIQYLAGSVVPFQWYNAGDFGTNSLQNADVLEVFKAACYAGFDLPPKNSDLYDAMDSANTNFADINLMSTGDGNLDVNDVYVTYWRSLDPTLTNYYRCMVNGARVPIATNSFLPMPTKLAQRLARPLAAQIPTALQPLRIPAADLQAASSQTIQIPITAQIAGNTPVRVLGMGITVQPLDGAPALTTPIAFSEAPGLLSSNKLTGSQGPNHFAAAWLDPNVPGISGTNVLGMLTVTLPDGLGSNAAYLVHFDHLSASPNGLAGFPVVVEDTLITAGDRSASSWNDPIPDSWRLRYFGTVSNLLSDASADADGDGASNLQEYLAGTNPMDAKSRLQVMNPAKPDRASCMLQWPTVANKQYVLEWANSLFSTNWTSISTNVGDGTTHKFIDTNATETMRFYRVRLAQ